MLIPEKRWVHIHKPRLARLALIKPHKAHALVNRVMLAHPGEPLFELRRGICIARARERGRHTCTRALH